jgi:hypothetical protein
MYSLSNNRFVCIAAGKTKPFDKVFPIQPVCRIEQSNFGKRPDSSYSMKARESVQLRRTKSRRHFTEISGARAYNIQEETSEDVVSANNRISVYKA